MNGVQHHDSKERSGASTNNIKYSKIFAATKIMTSTFFLLFFVVISCAPIILCVRTEVPVIGTKISMIV